MTAVDIVYTSCHDAVRRPGPDTEGRQGSSLLSGAGGQGPGCPSCPTGSRSPWLCWRCRQQPPVRPQLGRAEVGPSPHTPSGARKWTPTPHPGLGLPVLNLCGKELGGAVRPWGGAVTSPDAAGRWQHLGCLGQELGGRVGCDLGQQTGRGRVAGGDRLPGQGGHLLRSLA